MAGKTREVFMARQPIYDRALKVYAYEVLFRRSGANSAGKVTGAESAESLANTLIEIGLHRLAGDHPAFINVPQELLSSSLLQVLPKERVVLEILETIEPTKKNLMTVASLKEQGYRLALDDFLPESEDSPFFEFVDMVKVDVLNSTNHFLLRECVLRLKGRGLEILAEKVETQKMHTVCKRFGFDYFQGYFFAQPSMLTDRVLPPNRAMIIQLLTQMQDPNVGLPKLERIVSNDVMFSYRLLRLINSASFGVSEKVESIGQALMLLGINKVTALACLLAMSGVDDKPSELLVTAMVRAKMCESIAAALACPHPEKFFTAGLLSVLDALMDTPMEDAVRQLPLCDEIAQALLDPDSDNQIAYALRCVRAFERGDWTHIERISQEVGDVSGTYFNAVDWATEAQQAMAA